MLLFPGYVNHEDKDVYKRQVIERSLQKHGVKLSSLHVLMYLGSTESIKMCIRDRTITVTSSARIRVIGTWTVWPLWML